eukprot:202621_1
MSTFQHNPLNASLRVLHVIETAFIVIPVCIYCARRLHQNWNEFYMQKRGPILILCIYIFACLGPLFEYPYYSILKLINPTANYFALPHVLVMILSLLPRFGLLSLLTLRVYLLWFDFEYSRILTSKKWLILMNPSFLQTNWFSINKRKYGSSKYMTLYIVLPVVCIYYSTYAIIHISIRNYTSGSIQNSLVLGFTAFWMFIHAFICIKYWKRYPKFMDNLYIRQELKITIKILCAVVVSIFAVSMLAMFEFYDEEASIILLYIISGSLTFLYWLMVAYPQQMCNPSLKKRASLQRQLSNLIKPESKFNTYVSWKQITGEMKGYEHFCNFLEKEFAIENLMFITEYIMIKNIMKQNGKFHIDELELKYELNIPSTLETSLIASDFKNNEIFIEAVHRVYCKYINPSTANMEVNLSYDTRSQLTVVFAQFGNMDNYELCQVNDNHISKIMKLLERAVREISVLLNHSFWRFRSEHFSTMQNNLCTSPSAMSSVSTEIVVM